MKEIFNISYLRNILIISFMIAVLLPTGVVVFTYPIFTKKLTENTENESIRIAKHLMSMIVRDDVDLSDELKDDAVLDTIQEVLDHFQLMKLKLFSRSGKIVYSTDPEDIGKLNKKQYFHEKVAKGQVYTKVVRKNTKSLEDQAVSVDVVETYIPIMKNSRFVGAFEIYYDITGRKEELGRLLFVSAFLLYFLSACLLAAIILSLARAGKNITQRDQTEIEIKKQYAFFNTVVDSLTHPFYVIDANDYSIKLTNAVARQMGVTDRSTCYSLTHREEKPCESKEHPCPLQEVKRTKKPFTVEHIHYAKDGTPGTYEVHGYPIFDSAGNVVQMIEYSIDITKRKQAEEEIAGLSIAMEQAKEIIMIMGTDGIIQHVNPALEHALQYSRDELVGKKSFDFEKAPHQKELYQEVWEIINKGKVWSGNIISRRKDGTQFTQSVNVSPVFDQTGKTICFTSIGRDITKELLLEQRLQQSQKMEAIGTLAGGIAHDFNNILAGILGYVELSKADTPKDRPVYGYLNEILQSTMRAKDLVDQILAFSRKSGQELKPMKISPIIKETLKLLRATLPATIEIRQNIDEGSGGVAANPTQIHQVMMNLCTNAAQAMQEDIGLIDVRLRETTLNEADAEAYEGLHPGAYVKLTIQDNGSGIDPELIDRIFDPFFTTKEVGKGTGMGLSVTQGIVKTHGGLITVESRPGKGTTFDIFLPKTEIEAEGKNDYSGPIMKGTGHILFVDDEKSLTGIAQRMLPSLGYAVTVANTAFEALEVFEKSPDRFDLVMTDQSMPKMTGCNLSERLMKISPDIPIILCSGYSETSLEEDAKRIGIKAFVVKPLSKARISKIIHDVLNPQGV